MNKINLEEIECPNFTIPEVCVLIRNRFVTGKWKNNGMFLKVHENSKDDIKNLKLMEENEVKLNERSWNPKEVYEEGETRRRLEKLDLKKTFDTKYDKVETNNYSKLLKERNAQNVKNMKEFSNENKVFQENLRGFVPGTYLRIEVKDVPYEFDHNFELNFPIILGGLLPNERQLGFLQVRIKKHRWHKTLLKHNNPLIISMGWRRYQTIPIYSMEDRNNVRNRMIKYTPEHQHCLAHFYGPIAPPGTGMIGYLRNDRLLRSFRISATGTVLGANSHFDIQKKLKLIGYPENIHKNTCFIKEMFNSDIEASKFIGAKVRTVSKIRGVIKKVKGKDGLVRATFEDQLRISDIIFLRSWIGIEPEKFYNPLSTLLLKDKSNWRGLRTVGKICYEENIELSKKTNSNYGIIERPKQRFAPFKVSKKLQHNLPFKSKTKNQHKKSKLKQEKETIRKNTITQKEKKEHHFLQTLSTITHDRAIKKRKLKKEKNLIHYKKNQEHIRLRDINAKKKKKNTYRKKGFRKS